jgi:hypothetical protein
MILDFEILNKLNKEELINKFLKLNDEFISQQQQLDKIGSQLNEAQTFFNIFIHNPNPLVVVDKNFNIISFNNAFVDFAFMFYNITPTKGQTILDFQNYNNLDQTRNRLKASFEGKSLSFIDKYSRNNRSFSFKKIFSPVFNSDGEIQSVSIFLLDITEQVEQEKRTYQFLQTIEKVLNSLNFMIFIVNVETKKFLYSNKYFSNVNGIIEDKNYLDIFPDDDFKISNFIEKISSDTNLSDSSKSAVDTKEFFIEKYDRWFSVNYTKILWSNEQIGVLVFLFDITEERQNQENLQKFNSELEKLINNRTSDLKLANKRLENEIQNRKEVEQELKIIKEQLTINLKKEKEISKIKSQLLDNLSHEINTPLTIISSSIYLIERYLEIGNPTEIKKHINQINSAIKYLSAFSEQAQNIYISQFGLHNFNRTLQNLIVKVDELIQSIINSNEITQKIQKLYQTTTIFYETDYEILQQIIRQFLNNAIKYTAKDGIITIRITENEETIEISIIDNGVGIPLEDQKNIFDIFYRSKQTIGLIHGAGLGLSIAQINANQLGAKISFNSTPNVGSEFTITLIK